MRTNKELLALLNQYEKLCTESTNRLIEAQHILKQMIDAKMIGRDVAIAQENAKRFLERGES